MPRNTEHLTESERAFLVEQHLGTLTTMRADGTPHVVAIAFTYEAEDSTVSIICGDGTQKVHNIERTGRAAVCQVDGARWLTLEGPAQIVRDASGIAAAVSAFESRFRPARENPTRVAIRIDVDRVLGGA